MLGVFPTLVMRLWRWRTVPMVFLLLPMLVRMLRSTRWTCHRAGKCEWPHTQEQLEYEDKTRTESTLAGHVCLVCGRLAAQPAGHPHGTDHQKQTGGRPSHQAESFGLGRGANGAAEVALEVCLDVRAGITTLHARDDDVSQTVR
jgi:hypothetical protein